MIRLLFTIYNHGKTVLMLVIVFYVENKVFALYVIIK